MASCTQIDNMVQAYTDSELSASERTIFDQHIADCPACAAMVRRHQRSSALLFEALEDRRLTRSLRNGVLENLPSMERPGYDVASLNWRAKSIPNRLALLGRWVPVGVVAVLLLVTVVLNYYWPEMAGRPEHVGVVSAVRGEAHWNARSSMERHPAATAEFVAAGQRYETEGASTLMLMLAGPTEVKLNHDTRVVVQSDRELVLERGEIWLDVAHDRRLFKVRTSMGDVTVFGTAFNVAADIEKTTVTVERGEVQVENASSFRLLTPGLQSEIRENGTPTKPMQVDAAKTTAWAAPIRAEDKARAVFERHILPRSSQIEMAAEQIFGVKTVIGDKPRKLKAVRLSWKPSTTLEQPCGYDVYVTDDRMEPLFKQHIPAQTFVAGTVHSHTISPPDGPVEGVDVIHVKIVPDYGSGKHETTFDSVKAVLQ